MTLEAPPALSWPQILPSKSQSWLPHTQCSQFYPPPVPLTGKKHGISSNLEGLLILIGRENGIRLPARSTAQMTSSHARNLGGTSNYVVQIIPSHDVAGQLLLTMGND